jgi:hypothetical protein
MVYKMHLQKMMAHFADLEHTPNVLVEMDGVACLEEPVAGVGEGHVA